MDDSLAQQAINVALNGNWKKARDLNLQILKLNKDNTDALNRLARAYFELNEIQKAKKTSEKVVKIDPFNSIANRSLQKWSNLKVAVSNSSTSLTANAFLEEPGKTKTINLIHLGDKNTVAGLDSGDSVYLNAHSHRICVTAENGDHIGKIPDDVSIHLKKLIKLGYVYSTLVKSIDAGGVKIFIKEIKRPDKYNLIPSFSSEKFNYVSYTPPELVHEKPKAEFNSDEADESEIIDGSSDSEI